ncbi:DUF2975 domain-containing protein [uncultured Erythrobacter sp.]|uniref:DUF2975 domain-containing protein n=1 Tax=uncultured Erythrobacter sp. TaxID=263913 RepID=UPI0026020B5E|nr:DUF2975 domain-containing protein [uncultured Erythrobacter sp.]
MTMQDKPNDLLLLAGKVLAVLMQAIMAIGSVALAVAIPVILFFQNDITAEMRAEHGDAIGVFPAMTTAGIMLIALVLVALIFIFFGKLRAIISTVGEGEPFVPENAERLNLMAWLLLAVQVLSIPLAALALVLADWAGDIEDIEFTIGDGFDLTGILMVVVLFILARVFKHGAAMREDLEGTV